MAFSRLRGFLRAFVSVALLLALLFYIDVEKLRNFTPNVISPALAIALVLALSQILVTSARWKLLLTVVGVRLPLRSVMRTNVAGIIANILFINVVGGLAARAGLLASKGVPVHSVMSTSLLERVVILAVLVAMSLPGIVYIGLGVEPQGGIVFRIFVGLTLLTSIALLVAGYVHPALGARIGWVKSELLSIWAEIRLQMRNTRAMAATALLTLASQLLLLGVGVAASYATDPNVSLFDCAMILPVVALVSGLPISVSGLGLREASAVVLLGTLGMSSEQALMISVLISVMTLMAACIMFAIDMMCDLGLRARDDSVDVNPTK